MTDTQLDLTGLAPLHPVLPHAVVYSKPVCPNCDRLKQQLLRHELTPVNVDVTETPEAYAVFEEMNLMSTPIVIVHNVFERPVFYWGKGAVPVDQGKISARAAGQRLDNLVAAGTIDSEQSGTYLAGLATTGAAHDRRKPWVTPEEFVDLAEQLLPAGENFHPERVKLAPGNELTSDKSEAPALLSA